MSTRKACLALAVAAIPAAAWADEPVTLAPVIVTTATRSESAIAPTPAPALPVSTNEEDQRIEVRIDKDDLEHCLGDMRGFLEYAQATLVAALEGDVERVKTLAAAVRPPLERARALAAGTVPADPPRREAASDGPQPNKRDRGRFQRVQKLLPQEFRGLMLQMREGVSAIGAAADKDDMRPALRQLAQVQSTCIACHRIYRLAPTRTTGD